jgi:uncharacterized membrane protein
MTGISPTKQASASPARRKPHRPLPEWNIPLFYAIGAIVAGFSVPRLESRFLPYLVAPMNSSVAIAIDSSVASGMLAMTGIVFALAFVMVQFGAVAYSPRLVLWISRDPLMMHAIGTFTATFLYALWALAWIDRSGSSHVPFLSTALVVLMVLVSVGIFVGLVQRLRRLQVQSVLIFAGDQGRQVIEELYPPLDSPAAAANDLEMESFPLTQVLIDAGRPRAIQALDMAALLDAASEADAIIEVISAVGDTIGEGMVLLRVYGGRAPIDEHKLMKSFTFGDERTFEQDPKYAIFLLVDIAIRALSPAVNDPATAVQALDQIEDLLLRLGRRRLEIGAFRDANGGLRLVVPFPSWEDFLMLALEEIRHYGATSKHVTRRLMALLSDLADALPPERRQALRRQKEWTEAAIERSFPDHDEALLAAVEDRQGIGSPRRRQARVKPNQRGV